jgi:hypothetical protein
LLPVDVGLPAAVDALRADPTHGRLLDDGGLMPTADGLRIRTSAGSVTELDGPFAEAKEVVGGFFVVESPSAGAMATWARSFVDLHAQHWPELSYTAEVRQIADPPR